MATLGLSLVSGITFGAALTSASVYQPAVIINQMRLRDFHMLLAFLAASAASAIAIAAANHSGYARLAHRTDSTYGWFTSSRLRIGISASRDSSRYDANLVGGALLGAGMALTGACPGTGLVQLGIGSPTSAWLTAAGQVLGGIAFFKLGPLLKVNSSSSSSSAEDGQKQLAPAPSYTVMQKTGLSTSTTVLVYETLCLAMILGATYLPRSQHWLHPLTGGILIGLAQIVSIALTKKSLGVSGAYADIGKYFWAAVEGGGGGTSSFASSLANSSIPFATGIIAGASLLKHLAIVPAAEFAPTTAGIPATNAITALVGGFIMIFGARLAGGCTSGHGISGMSTMSFSSFITVAAMFAGGIAAAAVLY